MYALILISGEPLLWGVYRTYQEAAVALDKATHGNTGWWRERDFRYAKLKMFPD